MNVLYCNNVGSRITLKDFMNKFIISILLLLVSVPSMAQHYYGRHYHNHSRTEHVLGGVVLGAVLYDIYNRPPVQPQPQIIVQQPPIIVRQTTQYCTLWAETQHPDGSISRTRTCSQ